MLNLCFFIFVIYAVSYSAKAILFGKLGKKQKKAYCTARSATAVKNTTPQRRKLSKPNIVKIKQTKAGRMGKSPVRPVALLNIQNCGCYSEVNQQRQRVADCLNQRICHYRRVKAYFACQQGQT